MKSFTSFLIVLAAVGCGSLNIQRDCNEVDNQGHVYVCKKLGWFE